MMQYVLGLVLGLLVAIAPVYAQGEKWPARQVTVVVPYTAGGTTDMFGRILVQAMQQKYGTAFIVENRAGAAGNIGSAAVARASKDGYTLLIGTVSTHAINPFIYKNLTFDAQKDFTPVSLIARLPNLLVVNPNSPAKNVAELVEHVKKNQGKLTFGSSGTGASNHLAGELFQIKTGTSMIHVPYKSSGEIMNNLVGGHIDLAFDNMTLAWPQAKSGAVRPLGVTGMERSPTAPEVPTIAETLSGFDATSWHGLFAPAGTPQDIVDRLAADVNEIFGSEAVRKTLHEVGAVASPMTPDQFTAFIQAERTKWQEVVKTAKIEGQ